MANFFGTTSGKCPDGVGDGTLGVGDGPTGGVGDGPAVGVGVIVGFGEATRGIVGTNGLVGPGGPGGLVGVTGISDTLPVIVDKDCGVPLR